MVAKDGTPAEPGREPVVLGSVKRGTGPNEAPAPAASAESDLAKSGMKHEGSAVGGFVEGLTTEAMESPQSKEVAGEKKGETAASCSQGLVAGTLREGGEASLAAPPPGQGESPGELPPMFHRAGSHLHALDLVRLARSALAAAGEEKSEAEGGPKVATVGLAEQAGESQRMEGKAAKGEGSEEGGADDAKSIASAADEEEKIEKVATGDEGVDEAPAKQDGVARPVSAEKVVQFEEEEEDGGFASEEFERKENVAPKESDPVNQDVGNGQAGRLFGAKMIENKALVKGPTGGATKSAEAEESPEVGARSSRGLGPKRAENGKVSGDDGKRWGPGEQRSGGQGTDNSGRMGRTSGPGDGSKGHASRLGDVSKGQIGRFGDVSKRQISRFGDVSKKGEAAQQNVAGAPRMNSALGAGVIGIAATGAKPSGKGSGPGQPRDSARHHSQVGMDLGNNVFHDPSECPEFAIAGSGSRPAIDHMWEKISVARTSFPPSDNNEKRTRNSEDSFWDGRVSSPHIESIHRPRGKSLLDDTPDEPAPESAPNVHPDPPTRQIMTERTRRVAFGGVLRGEIPGGGRGTTVPAGGASVGGRTVEPVMPSVAGGVTAGRPNPGLTRRAAVGGLAIGVGRFGGTAGATEGGASGGGAQSLAGTEPAEARTMTGRANPVVVKKTGPSGVSAEEKKGPGGAQGGGKGGGKPPKGGGKGATAPGGTGPVWRG